MAVDWGSLQAWQCGGIRTTKAPSRKGPGSRGAQHGRHCVRNIFESMRLAPHAELPVHSGSTTSSHGAVFQNLSWTPTTSSPCATTQPRQRAATSPSAIAATGANTIPMFALKLLGSFTTFATQLLPAMTIHERLRNEPPAYTDPAQWTIHGTRPPEDLWPVIRDRYVVPLQQLWVHLGVGLVPSMRSVYRSRDYELTKGRTGNSLHTFPAGTFGAADLTPHDRCPVMHHLDTLVDYSPFRRICVYRGSNFVHVDYGGPGSRSGDRRSLWFAASPYGRWQLQSYLPDPEPLPR